MKKLRMVLLAGLLIAALCAPSHAWEFAMTGNLEWTYLYEAQGGPNGFFGAKDVASVLDGILDPSPVLFANPSSLNFSNMNTWLGIRSLAGTQFGLVTGLDGSMQYMKMVLNPEIRVNPAIRIRGQYWIGNYTNYGGGAVGPAATLDFAGATWAPSLGVNTDMGSGYYLNQQTGNSITRPIATGQWNMLWVTAQTPWGTLVFGKRPAPFGMGLNSDGERTQSSESLLLVAPYGPLRIGWFAHPWRQAVFLDNYRNINFGTGAVGGSISTPTAALGSFVNNTTGTRYPKLWDASNIRLQLPQTGVFVTYSNGPLEAGIIYNYWQNHQGTENAGMRTNNTQVLIGTTDVVGNMPTIDQEIEDGVAYVKYNNGRFFFNAELDWDRWQARFQKPTNAVVAVGAGLPIALGAPAEGGTSFFGGGIGSIFQPVDTEPWNYAVEMGALCGPSKLSLIYARLQGPDRRQGIWISKSAWENIAFGNVNCNGPLFTPYSYLMAYTYGTGMTTFKDGMGGGGITAASVVGARLDYAVAANLNWYGSFFWGWREGGWPVGCLTINPGLAFMPDTATIGAIAPIATLGNNSVDLFGSSTTEAYPNFVTGTLTSHGIPNIPDNNLGWEVTTGVDWKLLEGFTMNLRGAFWQPGEWFKWACIDRALATAVTTSGRISPIGAAGALAGTPGIGPAVFAADGTALAVRPGRSIDPIWAFQGSFNVDF